MAMFSIFSYEGRIESMQKERQVVKSVFLSFKSIYVAKENVSHEICSHQS